MAIRAIKGDIPSFLFVRQHLPQIPIGYTTIPFVQRAVES